MPCTPGRDAGGWANQAPRPRVVGAGVVGMEAGPSFASAVHPLIPRALHAARAFLGPRCDLAEDAVQEALLRAYRAWPALPDKERTIWPWLCTIVLRECRRQCSRIRDAGPLAEEARLAAQAPDPLESLVASEERAEAARALAGLTAGYRCAALLRYIHGLSCAEAAAVLGAPLGTVKWRLHEARGQVRRLLAPGEDAGRPRPEPREAAAPLLPPLRWTTGPAPAALTVLRGGWPPAALEVPGGSRVQFAVPSRVGGRHPAAWVGTDRGHHLWWSAGGPVWRASGTSIAGVRLAAEGAAAGG